MIACTSLVFLFCALGVHSRNMQKRKHAMWAQDYLTKTVFDTRRHVRHDMTCCSQQIFLGQNALPIYRVVSCQAKWNLGLRMFVMCCWSAAGRSKAAQDSAKFLIDVLFVGVRYCSKYSKKSHDVILKDRKQNFLGRHFRKLENKFYE